MKRTITYEKKIDIGYIFVIPGLKQLKINETIELDTNECINVDIDHDYRIVGLELFAEEADVLRHTPVQDDMYSLRFTDQNILSTYHFLGVDFHFSKPDHEGFIGFDIVDQLKYIV
ncbi:hypothetical protein BACPU_22850 [Bacillus pumilus]|nr:hypothetical protein BACPU_22850 [Bacillus pumilus]